MVVQSSQTATPADIDLLVRLMWEVIATHGIFVNRKQTEHEPLL